MACDNGKKSFCVVFFCEKQKQHSEENCIFKSREFFMMVSRIKEHFNCRFRAFGIGPLTICMKWSLTAASLPESELSEIKI